MALRWAAYADEQRMWDGRFGQLASIAWNAAFTGERRGPSFFFASLEEAERLAEASREPKTKAEAKRMQQAKGAELLAKMKQQFG
jgi:hypothetical protein